MRNKIINSILAVTFIYVGIASFITAFEYKHYHYTFLEMYKMNLIGGLPYLGGVTLILIGVCLIFKAFPDI